MTNLSLEDWANKYLSPAVKKHCTDLIENGDLFPTKEALLRALAKERIWRRRERWFWLTVIVAYILAMWR